MDIVQPLIDLAYVAYEQVGMILPGLLDIANARI